MRRLKSIILIAVLLIFLSACAQMTKPDTQTTVSPVLDRIMQTGELTVGTAGIMPPLSMKTKDGQIIGMEADIAKMMADAMGATLKFETMPFHKLGSALEAGDVDMVLSGVTITPGRNLKAAFVGPYLVSGKGLLTKIETLASVTETTEIDSPETILTALKGSTSQAFAESFLPKAQLILAEDYDEAVDLVIQDKAHALIADYPICIVSVFRHPNDGLLSMLTPLTYEPYGVALPPNDPHFVNWVENFLTMLEGSGQMDELKAKWFKEGEWLDRLP
ncbi:transporter substrate-binding domain-containing protein [Thermodesulfobacteriota bacterium]